VNSAQSKQAANSIMVSVSKVIAFCEWRIGVGTVLCGILSRQRIFIGIVH
jgi:hypothetical protein